MALAFTLPPDSVKFLIDSGRKEEARQAIMKVYLYADEKNADEYIAHIKRTRAKNTSKLSIIDALTHP